MKHIFKTLLSLVTICLPGCIFAQDIPLPDWLSPYIYPLEATILDVQERDDPPVLLTDSIYCMYSRLYANGYDKGPYSEKTVNKYDTQYHLSSYISTKYDDRSETSYRYTHNYNSDGEIGSTRIEFKLNKNKWDPRKCIAYQYDSNNQLIEIVTESYDFVPTSRKTYTYNADGYLIEVFSENPDGRLGISVKYSIIRNTKNQPTLIQEEKYYYFSGINKISSGSKIFIEYANMDAMITSINQIWNADYSKWVNDYKLEYVYSPDNRLKSTVYSKPSTIAFEKWIPITRSDAIYSNQTQLDTLLNFTWSGTDWTPKSLQLFQYNNGDLIKDSTYNWSATQWEITGRRLYKLPDDIYSIAFGYSEGTETQVYENGTWRTSALKKREYTDLGNEKVLFEDLSMIFKNNVLDTVSYCQKYMRRVFPDSTIEVLSNNNYTLTPNPYKTGQIIRCIGLENNADLTFALYNVTGTRIIERHFHGCCGLVLPSNVRAGMYIAVISQGTQRLKTTKLVILEEP